MKRGIVLLWTASLVLVVVGARPLLESENYDDELLEPKDTVRYPYAFWLDRPFYENYDDRGDDMGNNLQPERRPSTISYASVGGGWGR